MKATIEMKTLVINGIPAAAGKPDSLLRHARRIVRRQKLENPNIKLIKGIIFELQKAV